MAKVVLKSFIGLATLLFIFASPAHAHLIGGNGIASGVSHPFLGLDHLLAMVAVGILATKMGGKTLWKMPATFVSFMIVGGVLGIFGVALPFIETGIALSVLILGIGIALSRKFPLVGVLGAVALFAIFHGHAHGAEASTLISPLLYVGGFVLSTVILHIAGVAVGQYIKKTQFSFQLLRASGLALTLAGIHFLVV